MLQLFQVDLRFLTKSTDPIAWILVTAPSLLVGPWALEQLVSLERLTYVAYFVLVTCFLVFVQNKIFYLRCVFEIKVFHQVSNQTRH